MNDATKWNEAKSNVVCIVTAPGPKFFRETAYLADGSRVERTENRRDGYVTVTNYPAR